VTELPEVLMLWILARAAARAMGVHVPLLDPSSEPFPPTA
jgi:hypothetical protein